MSINHFFTNEFQSQHASDLMPNDKHAQKILLDRAKKLAKKEKIDLVKGDLVSFIKFKPSKHEYFGIPYHEAEEVIDNVKLTLLPNAPPCVAGVINRRGSLLTIIDLDKLFHINSLPHKEIISVIVVSSHGVSIGILAEIIEGSNEFVSDVLNTGVPYEGVVNSQFILGLHQGTTAILNIDAILSELQKLFGTMEGR